MLRDFRKCDLSINAEVIQFIFEIKKEVWENMIKFQYLKHS